jgi:hypothetical protein
MDSPILEQSSPPVEKSDDRRPVPDLTGPDHGADHRIQPGAVATTGKHSNAHLVSRSFSHLCSGSTRSAGHH